MISLQELLDSMPLIEKASHPRVAFFLHTFTQQLARSLGHAPLVVEIGVWCGMTSLAMALGGARVLAVDPFDGRDEQCRDRARDELGGTTFDRFVENAFLTGLAARVMAVVGLSADVAARVRDGTVDMLFVDGDHRREAVAADLAAWVPKLRRHSWIYGHDSNQNSVREAVAAARGLINVNLDFDPTLELWRAQRGD